MWRGHSGRHKCIFINQTETCWCWRSFFPMTSSSPLAFCCTCSWSGWTMRWTHMFWHLADFIQDQTGTFLGCPGHFLLENQLCVKENKDAVQRLHCVFFIVSAGNIGPTTLTLPTKSLNISKGLANFTGDSSGATAKRVPQPTLNMKMSVHLSIHPHHRHLDCSTCANLNKLLSTMQHSYLSHSICQNQIMKVEGWPLVFKKRRQRGDLVSPCQPREVIQWSVHMYTIPCTQTHYDPLTCKS